MTFGWLAQVPTIGPTVPTIAPTSAAELRTAMRKLWTDHVVWTRNVIISFAAGLPDLEFAEKRLLKNQDDIGAAIVPFYGAQAGNQLTALLRTHIQQAVQILTAARDKSAQLGALVSQWQANGKQIGDLLEAANPRLRGFHDLMRTHLDTTLAEAQARLGGKWAEDVAAYDAVYDHILTMSDALSSAIAAQFGLGGAA